MNIELQRAASKTQTASCRDAARICLLLMVLAVVASPRVLSAQPPQNEQGAAPSKAETRATPTDPCIGFAVLPVTTSGTTHERAAEGDDYVRPTSQPSQTGVTVHISPHTDIRLAAGYSLRMAATVFGTTNTAVEWGLNGPGCSGSGCGSIEAGVYFAPSAVPNPPIVSLTATSKADPSSSDSIRVCVVPHGPQWNSLSAAALIRAASLTAGQQEWAKNHVQATQKYGPMDVLSETNGTDFRPYLAKVLPTIKANWYSLIPASARAPELKEGIVDVVFKVMKDGTISEVRYTKQSGDDALDGAAYAGVTSSNPLPALPKDFGCQFVTLRIHFLYNIGLRDQRTDDSKVAAIPCVTTAVRFGPVQAQ